MSIILKEKTDLFISFLILFLPIALITGPFLSDLSIVILSIIFLFNFKKNLENLSDKSYLIFFLIFSLYLILSSLLSNYIIHSLESSLFYIRFIIFAYAFSFFLLKINNLIKNFYFLLLFVLFIVSIDGIFQYFFGFNFFGFENKYPWTPEYGNGEYHRISGFFRDELKLGSFISKFIPILVALYFFLNKFEKKK